MKKNINKNDNNDDNNDHNDDHNNDNDDNNYDNDDDDDTFPIKTRAPFTFDSDLANNVSHKPQFNPLRRSLSQVIY